MNRLLSLSSSQLTQKREALGVRGGEKNTTRKQLGPVEQYQGVVRSKSSISDLSDYPRTV